MKINSINNNVYSAKNQENQKKSPAFGAQVFYHSAIQDVISNEVVDI